MNLLITTALFLLVLGVVHGDTTWGSFVKTSSSYTWSGGRTYCQSLGGDLASIHSDAEKNGICANLGCPGEWSNIGLYWDTGSTPPQWAWLDGSTGYIPSLGTPSNILYVGTLSNNNWVIHVREHNHPAICRLLPQTTDIGPCTNHGLDGQSCSFHFDEREQTCTAGAFSLTYDNCDTKCDLECDLHPPRHPHCEDAAYLQTCSVSYRGYCQKDCGISTYVTSYKGCPNFPGWLSCPDYCCCDMCSGPPGPPGPPPSCPYYTRRFPPYGTCDNRKGGDNDQVCPPVQCPDDMYYLAERCVCVTKDTFYARPWSQANDYCATNYPGGHLMMMKFASEFNFLATHYTGVGEGRLWMAIRREGPNHPTFRYNPDDRKVTVNLWNGGEPNDSGSGEECVEAQVNSPGWNDLNCGVNKRFICEIEPYMMP